MDSSSADENAVLDAFFNEDDSDDFDDDESNESNDSSSNNNNHHTTHHNTFKTGRGGKRGRGRRVFGRGRGRGRGEDAVEVVAEVVVDHFMAKDEAEDVDAVLQILKHNSFFYLL